MGVQQLGGSGGGSTLHHAERMSKRTNKQTMILG